MSNCRISSGEDKIKSGESHGKRGAPCFFGWKGVESSGLFYEWGVMRCD